MRMNRLAAIVGLAILLVAPWHVAAAKDCARGPAADRGTERDIDRRAAPVSSTRCASDRRRHEVRDDWKIRNNRDPRDVRDTRDTQTILDEQARKDQRLYGNPAVQSNAMPR